MAIRVALADDSLLVLEGMKQLLAAYPDIEVVASCDDMPSLLRAIEDVHPQVVVSDIRMPPTKSDEGIQVAVRLRQLHPEVGVVILSQYAEPRYALKLLETGSEGRAYLLKERVRNSAQLVSAIESVAAGGSVIDPKVVEVLVGERRARALRSPSSARASRRSLQRSLRARAIRRSPSLSCSAHEPSRSTFTRSSPSSVLPRRRTSAGA